MLNHLLCLDCCNLNKNDTQHFSTTIINMCKVVESVLKLPGVHYKLVYILTDCTTKFISTTNANSNFDICIKVFETHEETLQFSDSLQYNTEHPISLALTTILDPKDRRITLFTNYNGITSNEITPTITNWKTYLIVEVLK